MVRKGISRTETGFRRDAKGIRKSERASRRAGKGILEIRMGFRRAAKGILEIRMGFRRAAKGILEILPMGFEMFRRTPEILPIGSATFGPKSEGTGDSAGRLRNAAKGILEILPVGSETFQRAPEILPIGFGIAGRGAMGGGSDERTRCGAIKTALLAYRTGNLGDDAQSLALAQPHLLGEPDLWMGAGGRRKDEEKACLVVPGFVISRKGTKGTEWTSIPLLPPVTQTPRIILIRGVCRKILWAKKWARLPSGRGFLRGAAFEMGPESIRDRDELSSSRLWRVRLQDAVVRGIASPNKGAPKGRKSARPGEAFAGNMPPCVRTVRTQGGVLYCCRKNA